uniref:C2H2-type domain-containing protein n=1 Tax=Meloidogyne enterolobii TaxID=390850 RepID=A0A6V7U1W6_MELEN|nr:unnamed protein product [Meloidogyne enterolobii]
MKSVHLIKELNEEQKCGNNSCPICGLKTNNLKDHLIEHLINTKTTWKCEKCKPSKIFFDIWSIKEHLFIYHTQAIFRCLFCLKLFTERSLLTEHLFIHAIQNQSFECLSCEIKLEEYSLFEEHVKQFHLNELNEKVELAGKEKQKIKESNEEYNDKHLLLSSSEYLNNDISCKVITSQDQQNLSENSSEFAIKTKHQKQSTKNNQTIANEKLKFKRKRYSIIDKHLKCKICDSQFSDQEQLTAHKQAHLNGLNKNNKNLN